MEPSVLTARRVVETASEIKYVLLGDVVVYQKTTVTRTLGKDPSTSISEGTTSWGGLTAFEQGAVSIPEYATGKAALVGTPKVREMLRTTGWSADTHSAIREALKDPYTRVTTGEATASDVLILQGQESATNVEGRRVPVAVHFDYINGHIDDSRYDLDRALAILKARTDIRFPPDDGRDGRPGTVLAIPHYNVERHRSCFLRFIWMPSVEDYQRLPLKMGLFEPHKTVFDLDLLGLKAGGATLFDDFYKHRTSSEDD